MTRKDEIKIIINYLKEDLVKQYKTFPGSFASAIVEYGKLLEKYNAELEKL